MNFSTLSLHPDFLARVEDAKLALRGKDPNVVLYAMPEAYVPRSAFPGVRGYVQSARRTLYAAQAVAACSLATSASVDDVAVLSADLGRA